MSEERGRREDATSDGALANRARVGPMERLVHGVFVAGLAASAILLAAGVALVMAGHAPRPHAALRANEIVSRSLHGDPLGWLYAGLLALMILPIVLVLLLAAGFARQREWRYGAAALAVLVALLVSLRIGMR